MRTDFLADVVATDDNEDLEGLARNIAAMGIHSPIHVRPDAERGYLIISGERRWRAAGVAGLETVPCLVASPDEHDAARNTLTQLSEESVIDSKRTMRRRPNRRMSRRTARATDGRSTMMEHMKMDTSSESRPSVGRCWSTDSRAMYRFRRLVFV